MSEKGLSPDPGENGPPPPKTGLRAVIARWWRGKVTPLHDLSWYVKWLGVICILTAVAVRTLTDLILLDFSLSLIGAILWVAVGFMWRDRSIIAMNLAVIVFVLFGVFRVAGFQP